MRFWLLILPFVFWPQYPGAASQTRAEVPVSRADLVRLIGELPNNVPIRRDMQRLGFKGENLELAVAHNEQFYRDPKIAGFIADRVLAVYRNPTALTEPNGLVWPAIKRGLGHLTTGELRFYYTVEQSLVSAMPTRDCGLAVRSRLTPQEFSEALSRVAARLEPKALKEYYRIEMKAARLGVDRRDVQLTSAQLARVEGQMETRINALIDAAPDTKRLQAALSDLDTADNRSACRIGQIFYKAVLSLEGRDLHNGLVYLGQQ